MKCPKCSKEIADDSQFCEFCGKAIDFCINIRWLLLLVLFILSSAKLLICAMLYYLPEYHMYEGSNAFCIYDVEGSALYLTTLFSIITLISTLLIRKKKNIGIAIVLLTAIVCIINISALMSPVFTHNVDMAWSNLVIATIFDGIILLSYCVIYIPIAKWKKWRY